MLCPHQEHDRNTILYFLLHQWEEPGKGMWLDDNFVSERKNKRHHHRPLVCGSKTMVRGSKNLEWFPLFEYVWSLREGGREGGREGEGERESFIGNFP